MKALHKNKLNTVSPRTVPSLQHTQFGTTQSSQLSDALDLDWLSQKIDIDNEFTCLEILVKALMVAHQQSASCIYIEPEKSIIRLRYRIFDTLQEELINDIDHNFELSTILQKLGSVAHTEIDIHVGAKLNVVIARHLYEISILPLLSMPENSLTIKLKQRKLYAPTLDELEIPSVQLKQLRETIKNKSGVFIVAGPANSNKKLTHLAVLQELNIPARKIISIESHIGQIIPRIAQIKPQLNDPVDFAECILDQIPDIVGLDKVHHPSLFSRFTHASLNSISVFTCVDANSLTGTVEKLLSQGISSLLLSLSLKAVLIQQPLIKICEQCKTVHNTTELEKKWINENFPTIEIIGGSLVEGEGCEKCHYTGMSGECMVYDYIQINNEMAEAILNADIAALTTAITLRSNFETLKHKALKLALGSIISLNQAMSVR